MFMSMSDFKYKSRLGKTWDTTALARVLALKYPGCKTLSEALSQARAANSQGEVKTDPEPSSLELKPSPERPRLPYKESDEIIDF